MWEHIQQRFEDTDKAENVETRCSLRDNSEPAHADSNFQTAIRESAKSLGLATTDLPSLAGQDAQEIARIAPMAMIFVPSKDGISHSPKEFTSWQDVANGAEVLYRSVLLVDGQVDRK
jgi:beta-ureidopropionase / N-carbamoyl-L-amino-acid hydrolase